jgi:hypothetical protein
MTEERGPNRNLRENPLVIQVIAQSVEKLVKYRVVETPEEAEARFTEVKRYYVHSRARLYQGLAHVFAAYR